MREVLRAEHKCDAAHFRVGEVVADNGHKADVLVAGVTIKDIPLPWLLSIGVGDTVWLLQQGSSWAVIWKPVPEPAPVDPTG